MTRRKFASQALLVTVMCGIIGLVVGGPARGAANEGNYTGKRELMKGSEQICGPTEENISVSIRGNQLAFNRKGLQATILFVPDPDGSFTGTFQDMAGEGTVLLRGRIVGSIIDADVMNQGCEYHWHLEQKQ